MLASLHISKELVPTGILVNELDSSNGAQQRHHRVHHHDCHVEGEHEGVLGPTHFEERHDWDDEVERGEADGAAEGHEVAEEGDGGGDDGDDDDVGGGDAQADQAVVEGQRGFLVVHHLLLHVEGLEHMVRFLQPFAGFSTSGNGIFDAFHFFVCEQVPTARQGQSSFNMNWNIWSHFYNTLQALLLQVLFISFISSFLNQSLPQDKVNYLVT